MGALDKTRRSKTAFDSETGKAAKPELPPNRSECSFSTLMCHPEACKDRELACKNIYHEFKNQHTAFINYSIQVCLSCRSFTLIETMHRLISYKDHNFLAIKVEGERYQIAQRDVWQIEFEDTPRYPSCKRIDSIHNHLKTHVHNDQY